MLADASSAQVVGQGGGSQRHSQSGQSSSGAIVAQFSSVRGLMQGAATSGDVIWALAASAALTAVFAPLTVWLYGRKG